MFHRGWATAASPHWLQLRLIAVLSLGGVVLGAWYMLWMYQRVFFGQQHRESNSRELTAPGEAAAPVRDLSLREVLCLTPLVIMIFWIGLQPQFFLDRMGPTVDDLMTPAMRAAEERGGEGETKEARRSASLPSPPRLLVSLSPCLPLSLSPPLP